jgi:Flp pilus assembly protein CpaB
VPEDALVAGAVTTLEDLRDQTTVAPIFAREQIPASRLATGESTLSLVGVSEGHIGVTTALDVARGGGGLVQRGDSVGVYASFPAGTPVTRDGLARLLSPQQINRFMTAITAATPTIGQNDAFLMPFNVTVALVPSVKVLAIQNPTTNEDGQQQGGGNVQITLDLLPEDARNLVFANEYATVWVGLLPPSDAEEGYPVEGQVGIDHDRLVGEVVNP